MTTIVAPVTTFLWVEILLDYIFCEQNYDPKPDFKYFQTISKSQIFAYLSSVLFLTKKELPFARAK